MTVVTSNIPEIIERLERWQAGLPGAIQKAFAPDYWVGQLQMVAKGVLQAQLAQWSGEVSVSPEAANAVVGLVQQFVDSVKGRWSAGVATFTAEWDEGSVNLKSVFANIDVLVATGQFTLDLDPATLERAKAAVAQWVAEEKILSEQDNYNVAEATERVQRILGLIPPGSDAAMAGWLASTYRQYTAGRLGMEIENWMARKGADGRFLTPEIVEQWLMAVLVSWREYARLHVRDRIEQEMNTLTRSISV